ncbi:hypothetical protein INR49_024404, partial [Caranx melampygus]
MKSSDSFDSATGHFDTSILPICKDSLGWMFNKLDMNFDLLLDQSELSAIYLDKYELCMKPLFNSCDSFKDGKLSNNEWCYCFQKPEGLPCQTEKSRIQSQSRRKSLIGAYIPRCTEEGYFKPTQCHGSTGQCWCVDKYGNEIAGSRKQGNPNCDEDQETSGDFGSGGAVILLDDQEEEPSQSVRSRQKKRRGRIHPRGAIEDDEDEEDDKDDEIGYICQLLEHLNTSDLLMPPVEVFLDVLLRCGKEDVEEERVAGGEEGEDEEEEDEEEEEEIGRDEAVEP